MLLVLLVPQLVASAQMRLALVLVPGARGLRAAEQVRLAAQVRSPHLEVLGCEENGLRQLLFGSLIPPATVPHRYHRRWALLQALATDVLDCNAALVLCEPALHSP